MGSGKPAYMFCAAREHCEQRTLAARLAARGGTAEARVLWIRRPKRMGIPPDCVRGFALRRERWPAVPPPQNKNIPYELRVKINTALHG